MNKREREFLEEIYKDCIELEKEGMLTEYGRGQKDLCGVLLEGK